MFLSPLKNLARKELMYITSMYLSLQGVELSDRCVSLPEEPITQAGEYTINITVSQSHNITRQDKIEHKPEHSFDLPRGTSK